MQIWPAIDLRGGNACGFSRATTAARPSLATIRPPWPGTGSARGPSVCTWSIWTAPAAASVENWASVEAILAAVDVPCELGGGIRDEATIARLLDLGLAAPGDRHAGTEAARLVPRDVPPVSRAAGAGASTRAAAWWPPTAGWKTSGTSAVELAGKFAGEPLAAIIYTDIATDGMLAGPNFDAMAEMQRAVDVPVVASGGVTTADDVAQLADVGVAGCIIGRRCTKEP